MQPSYDEQEVVASARQGDTEAVSLLYDTHVQAVFKYVRLRVDSTAAAEDLTAEVFLRMVRALPTYEHKGIPFRAWLYRIAANLITDHYRQNRKAETVPIVEEYESEDPDPFDHVALGENHARLRQALQALPDEYQTLLILRFIEDLPHTVIAGIMNKPATALRAMQHRALKALALQLDSLSETRDALRGDVDHE